MKFTKALFSLFFVIILNSFSAFAQNVENSGEQIRGEKDNAELKSSVVVLAKDAVIVDIEGDNDGFWIVSKDSVVESFTATASPKVFLPNAIEYHLKKGSYTIFPNLKENSTKAYVKVILKYE